MDNTMDTNLIDFNSKDMADRVIQWSNINSGSDNVLGLERMAATLSQAFSELVCEGDLLSLPPIEKIDSEGGLQQKDVGPLLRFWKRKEAPTQVLLMGHMDTVFPIDHPFQKAFFEDKDFKVLRGPGVADMKGGLCILLEALKAFEKSPNAEKLGWEIIINPDEEIGSLASAPFIQERAKAHHLALLFEPAMDEKGTLAGQRKGSGKFTIVVHGLAAHAGRDFHLGRNAICALSDVVLHLESLNQKREGLTINVGKIEGGGSENVVPNLAIARIDIRTFQVQDEAWIIHEMETAIEKIQKAREVKIELMGHFTRKPKLLEGKTLKLYELVVELARKQGENLGIKLSGGCSDGNNLSAAGLPNVDTLGVYGGKIHSAEEYLIVDSLGKRAKLCFSILSYLSENGF
jgi:glutamate carboxypeptidase